MVELMQDTFRGAALRSIPFYDQAKVQRFLDDLDDLDESRRMAFDPVMMLILSACVLSERFRLTEGAPNVVEGW